MLQSKTLKKPAWEYYSHAVGNPLHEIRDGGMWQEGWQMDNFPVTGPDKGLVGKMEREMTGRDKPTYLDIEIKRDLENGTTPHSNNPTTNRIPYDRISMALNSYQRR